MRYALFIFIIFLSSCDFFEDENDQLGTCVVYELKIDYDPPLNEYDCWDDISQTACGGTWYLNQSCLEFCEEKQNEQYTLCNTY